MRFFAALLATILIGGTAVAAPSPARATTDGEIDSAWIHLVNEDDVVNEDDDVHLDPEIEAEGHEQLYLSYPSRVFELELDLSELGDNHDLADGFTLTLTNGAFSGDYSTTITDGKTDTGTDTAACTTTWDDAGEGGGVLAGDVLCAGAGVNHGTTIPFAILLPATGPVILDVNTAGEDFNVYFFVAETGDTMYVGQGAIADGNGSCEAPDFSTDGGAQGSINAALFAAFTAVDDDSDVIVICDGEYVYEEDFGFSYKDSFEQFDGSEYHDSITLRAETAGGVTLYGGFEAISIEDLLLGSLEIPDIEDFYQLISVLSTDLSVTGIQFVGGVGFDLSGSEGEPFPLGGAISVVDGSLALERVTFDHNFGYIGGAVSVLGGSLAANRVAAQENIAAAGGAIAVFDVFSEVAPDSTISNSTFNNNYGIEGGGAVLHGGGRMTLTSVGFTENRVAGAGAAIVGYGDLEITGGYFQDNLCDIDWYAELILDGDEELVDSCDGGAIALGAGIFGGEGRESVDSLSISGTKFSRNSASGSGGAVYLTGVSSSFTIAGSSLTQNTAGDQGGAIRLDNANRFTTISGSVFTDNRAVQGGAISMNDGVGEDPLAHQWSLTRNTFTGNRATLNGGALHMAFDNSGNVSPNNVRSNRFVRNSAPGGGAIVVESDFGSERTILRRFERALRSNRFTANRAEDRRAVNIGVHFDE
jgi:predicted outer membrane repeat protein